MATNPLSSLLVTTYATLSCRQFRVQAAVDFFSIRVCVNDLSDYHKTVVDKNMKFVDSHRNHIIAKQTRFRQNHIFLAIFKRRASTMLIIIYHHELVCCTRCVCARAACAGVRV